MKNRLLLLIPALYNLVIILILSENNITSLIITTFFLKRSAFLICIIFFLLGTLLIFNRIIKTIMIAVNVLIAMFGAVFVIFFDTYWREDGNYFIDKSLIYLGIVVILPIINIFILKNSLITTQSTRPRFTA